MDDDDPLEQLRTELLDAYDRLQVREHPAAPSKAHARRARRGVVGASAIALTVSASVAAAIVIAIRPSAPLSGVLPRQLLGTRYALRITPDLRVGHAGWCVALVDIRTATSVLPNPSTCIGSGRSPLIARGGIQTISPTTGAVDGWLLYAIVDKQVAALKAPDNTRILPVASASLPLGWRAALTISANPKESHSTIATLTPVDAKGRKLPTRVGTPVVLPARTVDPRRQPTSGCRIDLEYPRGVRVLSARALRDPLPESLPITSGFLSCYSLSLDFHGHAGTATLLVASQHPGHQPVALPGAKPLRGHPGVQVAPIGDPGSPSASQGQRLLARRVAGAWLLVRTSAPTDVALALLNGLVART